ncbi:uracil-DNA glycosylase [Thiospirochaeta perfilievii]|uniref:Uracil-DNA glycosylase n=1 Tax=Thiospirochaeta perfilievii TaxID=252967 RepID=A0A5C1QDS0_9SPIO|nr:uracil-DNA glycosylase [Thiospirochaeta perfilievii]QEN05527.1 uracil-DNA glycosylase [Thiospirochaeta perfilievii]
MAVEWEQFIKNELDEEYFRVLQDKIAKDREIFTIYPKESNIYKAFEITPVDKIKCVIIGQDPYFNPDEAQGLAFSVDSSIKIPPSLRNIYKELLDDLGVSRPDGNLLPWGKQGVFLINRVLTVRAGEPNSHKDYGWLIFTKKVIEYISSLERPIVFMLWGAEARKLKGVIGRRHLILEAPHPSPLSSYRGFFGCKHFSKCNKFLKKNGLKEIDWGRE